MQKIGQQVEVAIVKETVRGTIEAPSTGDWVPRGGLDISQIKETYDVEANIGAMVIKQDIQAVQFENEITITMPLDRIFSGIALAGMYGSISKTADTPESGVNTFDYSILNTGLVPTYTIHIIWGTDKQRSYPLGIISNVSIGVNTEGVPEISMTFLTAKSSSTSALSATYATNSYFSLVDANFYMPETYADLATALAIDVSDVSVEFTRDPKRLKYIGSDTHSNVLAADFEVTMSVSKDFNEETFKSGDSAYIIDEYLDHATRAARLEFEDSRTTIGAATNPKLRIDIPASKQLDLTEDPTLKEVAGEDFMVVPVFTDQSNGYSIAQLITDESAY